MGSKARVRKRSLISCQYCISFVLFRPCFLDPALCFSTISQSFDMPGKVYTVYRAVPIAEGGDRRPYFGSTGNFKERVRIHRHYFNIKPKLLVYSTMHANGGIDNYRFEIVAEFDSVSYPEGFAARLAVEMEGALVREFGAVTGCLNVKIPGRSHEEAIRDRKAANPEAFLAAHRAHVAAYRARKKAAALALATETKTVV
jgi:hypothetical protein